MKRFVLMAVILSGILIAVFISWSCAGLQGAYSGPADSVVIAWSPFEHSALLYIAEDQLFFTRNGLKVTLHKYDLPILSVNGMLKGEADIVVGLADFAFVGRVLQKERIRTFGNIDKSEIIYLIGRRDQGIEKASDLKGKKVGITYQSASQFYFGRFLEVNGINMRDILLVNVKTPDEWMNAVVNGDIDAVVTGQPYVNSIKERMGLNAVSWPVQSSQLLFTLLVSTDEWIAKHPELVRKFLTSLAQAEEFVRRNPVEAKAIVQKRLGLDAAYMETAWSQNQFSLTLDRSLILAMEDEARWMISNGLTAEKTVPNFLDYIYEDGLRAIKPETVNIIR